MNQLVQEFQVPLVQNAKEIEESFFNRARNREEYMSWVTKTLIDIRKHGELLKENNKTSTSKGLSSKKYNHRNLNHKTDSSGASHHHQHRDRVGCAKKRSLDSAFVFKSNQGQSNPKEIQHCQSLIKIQKDVEEEFFLPGEVAKRPRIN